MGEATDTSAQSAAKPAGRTHQLLIMSVSIGAGALLLLAAFLYWEYDFGHPTADDASVQANVVWIAARVDAEIVNVEVSDNQQVKAGDLLFELDDRVYRAALQSANSELALVQQAIDVDQASLKAAEAQVRDQQAAVDLARERNERTDKLVARGDASKIKGVEDRDALLEAQARLQELQADVEVARQRLGSAQEQQARLERARAVQATAQLKQDWTRVVAPADGFITNFELRVGQQVAADQALFPLVESGEWWVQANYKETEVTDIRVGQKASVTLDSYPGTTFSGTVESISKASSASFSLLPPQNTTGNWVKVSQRIPVRVRLDPIDQNKYPLRVGSSASVTVDIDSQP